MHRVNRFLAYLALLAVLLIEQLYIEHISFRGNIPNIMLIFVVFFGLFHGFKAGLEIGFICGLIKDSLDIGVFGTYTLCFVLAGGLCGLLSDRLYRENIVVQFSVVFIAGYLVSGFQVNNSLYTAFIAPVLLFFMKLVFSKNENYPEPVL